MTCVTSECWSAPRLPTTLLLVDGGGLARELAGIQQGTGKELRVAWGTGMLWSEPAIFKICEELPLALATWPSHPHLGLGTRPGLFCPLEKENSLICLCRDLDPHMQQAPVSTGDTAPQARGKEAPLPDRVA